MCHKFFVTHSQLVCTIVYFFANTYNFFEIVLMHINKLPILQHLVPIIFLELLIERRM